MLDKQSASKADRKVTNNIQIPAAALKRFANELEYNYDNNVNANKFLQINRERVQDFIDKSSPVSATQTSYTKTSTQKHSLNTSSNNLKVAGINNYPDIQSPVPSKHLLSLQGLPEFNSSLGPRSRFGEGDGSFFDQWLNGDISKSKHVYDKDGFPLMKYALSNSHIGYKRRINEFKQDNDTKGKCYVKSYAERRDERIKSEQQQKKNHEKDLEHLPEISIAANTTASTRVSMLRKSTILDMDGEGDFLSGYQAVHIPILTDEEDDSEFKLPNIQSLTSNEKETYFGLSGREKFFECYRELSREYMTTGDVSFEEILTEYIEALDSYAIDETMNQTCNQTETNSSSNSLEKKDHTNTYIKVLSPRNNELYPRDNSEEDITTSAAEESLMLLPHKPAELMNDSELLDESNPNELLSEQLHDIHIQSNDNDNTADILDSNQVTTIVTATTLPCIHSNLDTLAVHTKPNVDKLRHLIPTIPTEKPTQNDVPIKRSKTYKPQNGEANIRPRSARSKFLLGCISQGVSPHPSLIIRKHATVNLSLSSFSLGDKVAIILSECLQSLPLLQGLAIDDNNLTDKGLVPIIKALSQCPMLRSFNISRNKVDALTATALLDYLSCLTCNLVHLIMSNADIDDYEASRFMLAIVNKPSLKELDMSRNLLGSHEFTVHESQDTGGSSIGKLLIDPRCKLSTLKLAWNMIRYASSVNLTKAFKINETITYLDLSYNGLSVAGGEMLGDALHFNHSLVTLNISNNNITARPCFVILSGVLSCSTLRNVDLSKNPIGEQGAKSLLIINLYYGERLNIDIRGCSLRTYDSTCWFDINKLEKEYELVLSNPYERSVCIELLRYVATHSTSAITSYQYKNADQSIASFDLMLYNPVVRESDGIEKDITQMDEARQMFQTTSSKIFKQYDFDDSGGLDRSELVVILEQLGIKDSQYVVDSLLKIYDTDGSGTVEEDEFMSFIVNILSSKAGMDTYNHYHRYFYTMTDRNNKVLESGNMSSPPNPYLPPDVGTVTIKLDSKYTLESVQAITANSVTNVLNASKAVADTGALFDYALHLMKLKFSEALIFYRVLLKEIGNPLQVICRLLPSMATTHDAKVFLNYVTQNDFEQLHNIRVALGLQYNIYIGLPNGFYRLNLSDENDYKCMLLLIDLSNKYMLERKKKKLVDISQLGNWTCFRNVIYDCEPLEIANEWLIKLPSKGRIEFDFVNMQAIAFEEKPISNLRLFRILASMGIVKVDKRKRIIESIHKSVVDAKLIANGAGNRPWIVSNAMMSQAFTTIEDLYLPYNTQQPSIPITTTATTTTDEAVANILSPHNSTATTYSYLNLRVLRPLTNISLLEKQYYTRSHSNNISNLDATTTNADNSQSKSNLNDESKEVKQINSDGMFILQMMGETMIPTHVITERILQYLENLLSGRYLTCAQLAFIIDKIPDGRIVCDKYSTYRVNFIVAMFTNITDVINFDLVLKELTPDEYAMIIFRIGWLSIINPMKIESCYKLNLKRWEDRQVLRILMVLDFVEMGPNWQEVTFQAKSTDIVVIDNNWVLPVPWFVEATLPTEGIISLSYFSGEGVGLLECTPDISCREILMCLVLSIPYPTTTTNTNIDEKVGNHNKNNKNNNKYNRYNIEHLDDLLEKMGCKLSFRKEL